MKRISIAEQTLKKQIEQCRKQRDFIFTEIEKLKAQADTYFKMIDVMETEQDRLRKQREAASHKELNK